MNEKITIQDLIDILAEKHSMNKKDAELFVKGVFELIEEALATEKYVKVKGLGTFKLIGVDSRESVDVNTGERIEIQGHNKISFTPESSLKDLINKPFAHFETVILNEGVDLSEVEAVDVPKEDAKEDENLFDTIKKPERVMLEETIEEMVEVKLEEPEERAADESVKEEFMADMIEEPIEEEASTEEMEEPVEESIEEQVKKEGVDVIELPVQDVAEENKEDKKEEKTSKVLIVITIILIILILAGLYWLFRPSESMVVSTVVSEVPVAIDTTVQVVDTLSDENDSKFSVPTASEKSEVTKEKVAALSDTTEYRIVGTKATYTLQDGETLIRVALKFYGSKNYWPYIAKHNEKTIKNVNNVPKGTVILIPELQHK